MVDGLCGKYAKNCTTPFQGLTKTRQRGGIKNINRPKCYKQGVATHC
jgi:hypothetical protein